MPVTAMTEDALLTTVLQMSRLFGILTAHFRPALSKTGRWMTAVQGNGKGFPDLTLAGHGGLLFRELKTTRGVLSPEQKTWLAALTAAGADAGVWRPDDLHSGRIEAELRAIRRTRAVAS